MLSKHSTNRVVSLALSTILNINCRFLTIELTSASQLSLHKPPKDVPIRCLLGLKIHHRYAILCSGLYRSKIVVKMQTHKSPT